MGSNGQSNSMYDYGFRIYNPQLARFLSVDPLSPDYPWYTPYQFAGNMPTVAVDLDGLEQFFVVRWVDEGKLHSKITVRVTSTDQGGFEFVYGKKMEEIGSIE
jgi:RHS repeat-associated protein